MTAQSTSDLPRGLEAELASLGVISKPVEACKPANPWKDYVAWKPSFDGEEPPF